MTNTEDQLRDALALLEQRAADMSPATFLIESAGTRRTARRWLLPLASAAAVFVLVAAVVVLSHTASPHSPATIQAPTATTTANPATTTCLQTAAYRQGSDSTLVPGSPSSLTICQYANGPTPTITTTTDTGALVAALRALSTNAVPTQPGCRSRYPGALPARGTYELLFHYPAGPDVVVNVLPECRPSINNSTSLQVDDAATIVTILQRLVPPQQNLQYGALAINTSCIGAHCQRVRSPSAIASLVHATACAAWQLNPGSHGGPHYLVRVLVPSGVVEQDRSQIAPLPGVDSVDTVPARDIEHRPATEPNFAPPTPIRCG
jgi:hypothetical protein